MLATPTPSSARTRLTRSRDQPDADDQSRDRTDHLRRCLGLHRQAPRQAAGRDEHLAERPSCRHDAEQADADGDPAGAGRLRERGVDLGGEAARDAGAFAHVVAVDPVGDETQQADEEQQQRHEEQEEAEGDGAADHGAGRLAIAAVEADRHVDNGRSLCFSRRRADRACSVVIRRLLLATSACHPDAAAGSSSVGGSGSVTPGSSGTSSTRRHPAGHRSIRRSRWPTGSSRGRSTRCARQ